MPQPDPSSARTSPILTLVPLLVLGGALAVMVKRFAEPVTNPDTFFHLRLGRKFLEQWTPWDPGTVTPFATAEWSPTQWLSQVLYAGAERWFGLPGVAWLSGTVAIALVVTMALVARRFGGLLVAALVTALAVFGSLPFLSSRPQVASYLFLVLVTAAWLHAGRGGRVPWWTIPLTWVWAMVHGMWISGIIVGLGAALGLTLDRRSTPPGRAAHPLWAPWLVPVLSLVAAGLTPVGPALWSATARVGGISAFFTEWSSPEFTDPFTASAALMLAITLLIRLRGGSQSWLDLCLLAMAGGWMLYAERSVPVAVAILVPMLATSLSTLVPRRPAARWEGHAVVALGVVASAVLAATVPFTAHQPPREDSAASRAVAGLPAGSALLNNWGLGGTDMWLYPDLAVVMHGYGDMFTDAELERNLDIQNVEPGWDQELRSLRATHALLLTESPLAYALENGWGWTVEAQDDDGEASLVYLVAPEGWLDESAD